MLRQGVEMMTDSGSKSLTNKIDFALVFTVKNANPNGDPLNGNMPRTTYTGLGEVSDVCLKRKLRNRLLDEGQSIFVRSNDSRSLRERASSNKALADCLRSMNAKDESKRSTCDDYAAIACRTWYDVRAFGQVFLFKMGSDEEVLSIGVRGPVSIQPAFSIEPVNITSFRFTKSICSETEESGSNSMGMKHRVDFGVYVTYGSISACLAEKTGFSDEDALPLKNALLTIFQNDESSARPSGSMEVEKLVWWEHNCKRGQYSSKKVHSTLKVSYDEETGVTVKTKDLDGLMPEIIDGGVISAIV